MATPIVVGRASLASFVVERVESIIALTIYTIEIGVVRAVVLLIDWLAVPVDLLVPIYTVAVMSIPYFILSTSLRLLATTVHPHVGMLTLT